MTEILKQNEKSKEKEKDVWNQIKCETINCLSKFEREILQNEVWHEVKTWENIWRIIYEHSKISNHLPLKADDLIWISVNIGDKIFFSDDKVIIKRWNKTVIWIDLIKKNNILKKEKDLIKKNEEEIINNIEKETPKKQEEEKEKPITEKKIYNQIKNEDIKITNKEEVEDKIDIKLIDLTPNQKTHEIKIKEIKDSDLLEKPNNKNKEKPKESPLDLESFMKLDKKKRFELITIPQENWYYKIVFPNKEIEQKVTINDIIPNNINNCEIIKDREFLTKDWKKAPLNYFDIVSRDYSNEKFTSIFSWNEYNKVSVMNWYLIKPIKNLENNNQTRQMFFDYYHIAKVWNDKDNTNEENIRWIYGQYIKELITNTPIWSIIDEKFIYRIIAKESRFNPNAISPTWARWLWQFTIQTVWSVIKKNQDLIKSWYDNSNNFLITQENLLKIWKNLKYDEKKWIISGLETELYEPKTAIKLILNYLIILEEIYSKISDKNFKQSLILASYNAWPWALKNFIDDFWVKNIKDFSKWKKSSWNHKLDSSLNYAQDVQKFYKKNKTN